MSNIIVWGITPLLELVAACFFFLLDRRILKHENGQHIVWYRRSLFIGAFIFLVPLLGVYIPEIIISLVVFHGLVLPYSSDFNYQLFTHSLSFFTWLAIFSYAIPLLLFIYIIYLGLIRARYQQEKE